MRHRKLIIVFIVLLAYSSCEREGTPTVRVKFPSAKRIPFTFDTTRSFTIQSGHFPALTGIGKIDKLPNGDYAILGGPVSTLYWANSFGMLQRLIATTGEGPTGFPLITDFCVAKSGQIFTISDNPVQIGVFDSEGRFLRRYNLPWIAGESIRECKDGFVIGAMVVYDPSKGTTRSEPLNYGERRFILRYDSLFSRPIPMLRPSPELSHTDGLYLLPYRKFAPFAIAPRGEYLWAITQEGFYRIEEFDTEGRHLGRLEVESSHFVPVKPDAMVDFRKVGYDQAMHGKLIASHSAPDLFLVGRNVAIIRMNMPYGNYYPQYRREAMPEYYYDLFLIQSGRLTPLYEGFKTGLWLVGVERNSDTFYFTKLEFQAHEISPPRIYVVTIVPDVTK